MTGDHDGSALASAVDSTSDSTADSTGTTDAISTALFGPLTIEYDARVLEPRAWTAMQSHWAGELLTQPDAPAGPVLELCAGAGQIGLLAALDSRRDLVAVDVDPVACAFALSNAERAGISESVRIRCSPIDDAVGAGETFAVVVADPPWVPSADVTTFPDDPRRAIDGGPDGLDLARRCVEVAETHLVAGGSLLLQLGTSAQCDSIAAEAAARDALVEDGRRQGERGWILHLVRR